MGFFLGIDGGGSKTDCVLADESGALLGRASGPGANLQRTSPGELRALLTECFHQLCRGLGLRGLACEVVCAGFAGGGTASARDVAREVLEELLSPRFLYVTGDMEIALEAAVGEGPGVVLIAGTGSIAFGRNASGETARAGGRGPEQGDEGSGYAIGRAAVEAALRGEGEALPVERLLAALAVSSREELGKLASAKEATRLATLVSAVVDAARAGNSAAQNLLMAAGDDLARLAVTVLQELGLAECPVRVATSGGVFAASEEVFHRVREKILGAAPQARVEPLAISPAEGAVHLGQRLWLRETAGRPK